MPVRELHRQVAAVALEAAARYGFGLAGGNALILHQLSDRYTQDVDLFTDAGEQAVEAACRVDHTADEAFALYGLTPADITQVRNRLAVWPRTGHDDRRQ